jgi:hypothetical protein
MADMNVWIIATISLLPVFLVAVVMSGLGTVAQRFVAIQLTSTLAIFVLVMLTFVLDQASSTDLPLTVTLLTLPATLLFAFFVERWL